MKYFITAVTVAAMLAAVPSSTTATPALASQNGATSNDTLATKVKAQIATEAEFRESQIEVGAVGGDVTLTGVASTAAVRMKIVEKTKATEGVTKVINKVTIAKAKK